MSAVVYCVVTGIVAAYVALAVALYRRERRRPLERDRLIREAHDVGPDNLRLLEELDAHLDAYMAQLAGLYERPHIALDPVYAAGLERLRDATCDQHNDLKGGS